MRQTVCTGGDVMMFVPVKSFTRHRHSVSRIGIPHGQMQRHNRVTTRGVGKGVRQAVRAGGDVRMFVPVETIACKRCSISCVAVAHGQVQRHHAVATRGVGKGTRQAVCAGGDVRMFVPIKTIAGKGRGISCVAVAHGQMQRHHAVATGCIRKRMRQAVCAGGDVRVLVPVEAIASERRGIARVAVAHRQVQRHHAVATRGVGERVGKCICTGSDVRVLVPVETVACERRRVACVAMADCQVQRHH